MEHDQTNTKLQPYQALFRDFQKENKQFKIDKTFKFTVDKNDLISTKEKSRRALARYIEKKRCHKAQRTKAVVNKNYYREDYINNKTHASAPKPSNLENLIEHTSRKSNESLSPVKQSSYNHGHSRSNSDAKSANSIAEVKN